MPTSTPLPVMPMAWRLSAFICTFCAAELPYCSDPAVDRDAGVGSVAPVVKSWGVSEFFLGIVIIPLVGNVAEHLVAVQTAVKNKMELSLAVSVGSSLQIALFVAPLLVFVSLAMGNPLTLVFNQFELIALVAAVLTTALVSLDGESIWLEGAQLLSVYVILVLAFFFL